MELFWKKVKTAIRKKIPGHTFSMWIEPLQFAGSDARSITLHSPNCFSKNRVKTHYLDLIRAEVESLHGQSMDIIVDVLKGNQKAPAKPAGLRQQPLPNMAIRPQNGRLLRRDFTFDQFVVGESNDFAYSAALSLASHKQRRNSCQNALFLLSKPGMGKSHLSQAIGHFILSEFPGERVYYMTAEDFSSEMVHAFREDVIDQFKEKYRRCCDVLLLEDVHYLSGKERTQVELALTLDALLEADRKIIFSSCYQPSAIPKLSGKLRSRLSYGLLSTIEPPDFKTRVRILHKKARAYGSRIPDEIVRYLASELTEDVRQLESGLVGVSAKSSLMGIPADLSLAESVVKYITRQRKKVTIEVIKKLVCRHYNVSAADIVSRSRKQAIVRPRQIAMYLARRYTDSPLQVIGKSFNRYHATALHAIGSVEKGIQKSSAMKKQVMFLQKKLETGDY